MNDKTKQQIIDIIEIHKKMVAKFEADNVELIINAADMIIESLANGGVVYLCGNGGSAADAQHIAGELVGKFRRERKALPAIAISTDTSVITSVANDYSYDDIFARQVEALLKQKDVLWAISTSGNSPNVVAAAKLAKEKGASVLAFTGEKNCKLEQIADVCFCADNESTARSQEIHQLAYHIICDMVEQKFCEK